MAGKVIRKVDNSSLDVAISSPLHTHHGPGSRNAVIGTMSETGSTRLSRADVLEALMWALEHDVDAFDEHRAASLAATDDLARKRASKRLVEHYRSETSRRR